MTDLPSISVTDLAAARETGATLLDVREPDELAICAIDGAIAMPMREVPERWEELRLFTGPIYCLCHHGMRSAMVARLLREKGLDAVNVAGGIDAWAVRIDSGMTRY